MKNIYEIIEWAEPEKTFTCKRFVRAWNIKDALVVYARKGKKEKEAVANGLAEAIKVTDSFGFERYLTWYYKSKRNNKL